MRSANKIKRYVADEVNEGGMEGGDFLSATVVPRKRRKNESNYSEAAMLRAPRTISQARSTASQISGSQSPRATMSCQSSLTWAAWVVSTCRLEPADEHR